MAKWSTVFILFLSTAWAWGQQYNFRSYSLEEGLPQSEVRALIQDQKGNIWLGTNGGGLCRFNGREFEVYTKKQGLPDNIVGAVFEDSRGILWVATSQGMASYDGISFTHYSEDRGIQDGQYFWIKEDASGRIWVLGLTNTGNRAMLYLDGDHFVDFTGDHPELSEDNFIFWVFQDSDRVFHIITKNGLFLYDGESLQPSPLQDLIPPGQMIFPFLEDQRGDLWVATGEYPEMNMLYRLREDKLLPVSLPAGIIPRNFNFALEDSDQNVWISVFGTGVLKGVIQQDEVTFQLFTRNNGLPINMINNILEDREGNIWLGTNGGGLIKYSSDQFVALNVEDGLSSEIIRAISQDSHGDYWFGTTGGAVIKFDGTTVENIVTEEESELGFIRKFLQLKSGNLLIASFTGLWEYDGKQFKKVNLKYDLPENARIGDVIQDGNDLLVSVLGRGVARFDGQKSAFITAEQDSIATNNVTHLMKDSQGNIWLASTLMGVTKYQADPLDPLEPEDAGSGSRVERFNSNHGLNNDYIIQIAEDNYGKLWFASYGGGLNIYDGKEFTYLDSEKGLTSDNIYSVIKDVEGNIWAGTQNGVDKITLDDEGEIISITNYDRYDGFTGIEANGMANYRDSQGNLWFGTIKGVMRYNPSVDEHNPTPPLTNITRMKLFFKDVSWEQQEYENFHKKVGAWNRLPQDLELPYDLNHVSFEFEALSFKVPEKVKYQWKLEGLDKDWSPVTSRTEAVYPNLPPGDYTFLVKASNNDGVWNELPAAFQFSINAPWWATWWFKVMTALILLGAGYLFYKWRVTSIKEKRDELERLVQIKTQEVVQQKDEILMQSKQLEESYHNLELLSEVGRNITSNLSVSNLITTVYHHVKNLMEADVFWIGILNTKKQRIEFSGAMEAGKVLPDFHVPLSEENRLAVWCLNHQKEIFINNFSKEYNQYIDSYDHPIAGEATSSIIYVPLVSQDQVLGVLSVQSYNRNAYQEHHLSLIRNIAVHTKIALENASAYEKITDQSAGLRQQKSQIELKNRELTELNHEKNHLIGIVAHDLRNPLTSALTIGGMLKSDKQLSEEQREYTSHMLNAMERMNDMVNRILDIKAIESKSLDIQLEKTNLAEVLEQVQRNFQDNICNKKLNFSITVDHPKPVALVDRNYLTQVFENLLSNAIKFSPPGRDIKASFLKQNGYIVTAIEDQGPGITDEDRDRLFQKYQKLSARPTGGEQSTGLGLSIVKKFVEAMNGKVWCESVPGTGATFKVQFQQAD